MIWQQHIDEISFYIEKLEKRISELEQALSQAGDSIELLEAEERGFQRGKAWALDKEAEL